MSPRIVGLDIGSHAVRAADVDLGDPPELRAFGQVGLPRGAVEHGEVVDPGTVAAAIKRLWRESHIRDRRVRVGLANLRTIVRQVELPAMGNDEELRGAIEFQAGDFIPLPVEEIELDFRVLESFVSEEGESMSRVLIAAIHRDSLENALVAVREAGLQPVAVDLVPFALVRSLRSDGMVPPGVPDEMGPLTDGDEGGEDGESFEPAPVGVAEALVSVGSGVTVVVIHEMGVPRFVRIVDSGGDDLTDAIRTTLDFGFEEAELLKRQLSSAPDRADEARAAMEAPLASLVNEIRGSIDFYVSRPEAHPIDRIFVTGGAVRTEGFLDRLSEVLPVEAEAADPFVNLQVGDIGFLPEEIENLSPYLPVPVGLALGGDKLAPARVNLLPGGERRVLSTSRLVMAGALVVLVLIGALSLLTTQRNLEIADAEDRLEGQQARNQQLQAQIAELSEAEQLQAQAAEVRGLLAGITTTDVAWSRVLREVAGVVPGDVWLVTFSAQAQADEATGTLGGSVAVTAQGTDFPAAAAWLQRLSTVPSFSSPWVSEMTQGEQTFGPFTFEGIDFTSTAGITPAALSARAREAAEEAGDQAAGGTTGETTATTAPPQEPPS